MVNLFWRSPYYKQRVNKKQIFLAHVNKKQNVEIDSSSSSGGLENCVKCVGFPWSPLETALSVCNLDLFLIFFKEETNKNEADWHHLQILSFLTVHTLKRSVR